MSAFVNGRFLAGEMREGWSIAVSFLMIDGLSGALAYVNDNDAIRLLPTS